jgi:hypothetical protein
MSNVDGDVKQEEISLTAGGDTKWCSYFKRV